MNQLKMLVADLAGTTVHDPGGVAGCLIAALAEAGHSVDFKAVDNVMGIPKPVAIKMLLGESSSQEDVVAIHADFRSRMIRYYEVEPAIKEIPGTAEAFEELRRMGLRICLDTGFDRETTEALLKRMPWGGLIDGSVTSDEVANGRPYPDLIHALATRFELPTSEIVKIGDTPSDLQEGHAAGVALNIGVTSGAHSRAELSIWPHSAILDSIAELPGFLREHQGQTQSGE
jgi:phosphonatase-like hydrolase